MDPNPTVVVSNFLLLVDASVPRVLDKKWFVNQHVRFIVKPGIIPEAKPCQIIASTNISVALRKEIIVSVSKRKMLYKMITADNILQVFYVKFLYDVFFQC